MANDFLKKLETAYKLGFNDGQKTGQQQAFDAATICLIREGRSGQQLVDFFNQSVEVIDQYAEAWNPSMEQDVAQVRLDEELEAGYDGAIAFLPFAQRYPDVKTLGYDKPIKEERHPAAKKAWEEEKVEHMEMCATCVHRREEEVESGLFGLDCEYECSGALQFDERTGKVTDCEDYEADDDAAERW